MPDLAASVQDIQVQRGITNSIGGMTAIGGTVNIVSANLTEKPSGMFSLNAGSYGFSRQMIRYQTGKLGKGFSSMIRLSKQSSDGYRDNNELDEKSINSDIRYTRGNNQLFLKANWFDQELELPGVRNVNPDLGINQLKSDRRGTSTPRDYADQDGFSINPGINYYWEEGTEAVIDFGYRTKN